MLEAIRYVDLVIPECNWEQKPFDIQKYQVDTVVMGGDWAGSDKFEYLKNYCELVYLDRTEGISTSKIKKDLLLQEPINGINQVPQPAVYKIAESIKIFSDNGTENHVKDYKPLIDTNITQKAVADTVTKSEVIGEPIHNLGEIIKPKE